ncbi:predicted protein [Chaetomium globosum CBS 148.51]|uniref:Glycosyltransferase family 28 N-terminal domain-containing protein n=1 Tax=Chaetomium globosum (strain ATCC 6205 / CBS 148.51 / DSM 1962 / NBRC 6347 / NRRL 1970) TaxID=306901 RepID=Q2HBI9_CHAGB|nr:uncharacterized protein CHGG_02415 [Chaetomium globosum CBS 148.51]EAQ90480.1 predicted protein [Chaetomium globosum CBS 148.51]
MSSPTTTTTITTTTPTPPTPLPPAILILCTTSTAPGHVLPLTSIARHLTAAHYPVTFVGAPQHRALIEASGATFFPVCDALTLEHGPYREWGAARARYAEGLPRMVQDFRTFFVGAGQGAGGEYDNGVAVA